MDTVSTIRKQVSRIAVLKLLSNQQNTETEKDGDRSSSLNENGGPRPEKSGKGKNKISTLFHSALIGFYFKSIFTQYTQFKTQLL